jgi:hypothetical protein
MGELRFLALLAEKAIDLSEEAGNTSLRSPLTEAVG